MLSYGYVSRAMIDYNKLAHGENNLHIRHWERYLLILQ